MELSWSTFVLEIINFLVLVWILKRFLYKPVLAVIASRRAAIDKALTDARTLHADAQKLQEQYTSRFAEWERERQQRRESLDRELETEKTHKMAELQDSLKQEREKIRVSEARRQSDAVRKMEDTALTQGARFATRLLEQASGPELETRLIEMVISGLQELSTERISNLRNSYGKPPEVIVIRSVFPIVDDQRQRLEQALTVLVDANIPLKFEQDNKLVAGVAITIGAWVLGANLRDELKGFMQLVHNG